MDNHKHLLNLSSRLKQMIADDRMAPVFKELSDFLKSGEYDTSDIENTYIILSSEYKRFHTERLLMTDTDYSVNIVRIKNRLIELIDDIVYLHPRKNGHNLPATYSFGANILAISSSILEEIANISKIKEQIIKISEDLHMELSTKRHEIKKLEEKKKKLKEEIEKNEKELKSITEIYNKARQSYAAENKDLEHLEKELKTISKEKEKLKNIILKEEEEKELVLIELALTKIEMNRAAENYLNNQNKTQKELEKNKITIIFMTISLIILCVLLLLISLT